MLISRAKGIDRAATAVRSSFGMSVQPDVPFFVSAPPPSRDVPERAATAVRSPHGMSVQPDIPIFFFDAASLMGWWLFSFLCILLLRDLREQEGLEKSR